MTLNKRWLLWSSSLVTLETRCSSVFAWCLTIWLSIACSAMADQSLVVIKDVTVISPDRMEQHDVQDVVIQGDRIIAIEKDSEKKFSKSQTVANSGRNEATTRLHLIDTIFFNSLVGRNAFNPGSSFKTVLMPTRIASKSSRLR